MSVILSSLVLIFSLLFNVAAFAKSRYGSLYCNQPNFYCYKVKRGDSWDKLFKDATEKNFVMKINRINIRLYPGLIIARPKQKNMNIMDFAPFPKQISAPGEKTIFVSLQDLAWGAYESNGSLINWGPVSGGKGYCGDEHRRCHTALGKFAVYSKEGAGCVSTKFPVGRGGAPMPYCMFFHGGFALHGSYEVPGYNASHGCVRMFVNDAEWLNKEFVDIYTPVIIKQQSFMK